MGSARLMMVVVLVGWSGAAAVAEPEGIDVQMKEAEHRRVMVLAEHNGAPTVVGERVIAVYEYDETLEARCGEMEPEERLKHLPCYAFEAIQARQSGDLDEVRKIYEPGADLDDFFPRGEDGKPTSGYYEECASLFLTEHALWDEYAQVKFGSVKLDGTRYNVTGWVFARRDPETGKWRGTQNPALLNYPFNTMHSEDVIEAAPAGLRAFRLSLGEEATSQGSKYVIAEELADRSEIEWDDIIVYVGEEKFEHSGEPFVTIEASKLDAAARQLQKALKTHMALCLTDDVKPEEYLKLWSPAAHKRIMRTIIDPVLHYHAQEEDSPFRHHVVGFPGKNIGGEKDIALMRVVTRVFTDRGVITYGVTPSLPKQLLEMQPDKKPGPRAVVFYQFTLDDGSWVMLSSSWGTGHWRGARDDLAMRVLGDVMVKGVAETLTRGAREKMWKEELEREAMKEEKPAKAG